MDLHPEEPEAGPWRDVDDEALRGLLEARLPGGRGLVLVDGRSGSGKTTFANRVAALLDGVVAHTDDLRVWVQSDRLEARERGLARDVELGRTPKEAVRFWDGWLASEEPFLADERPWERADLVVRGRDGHFFVSAP